MGDSVRPGVEVIAVQRDAVVLPRGEEDERLGFPDEPVATTGREVFYPDFVDFDARINAMDEASQLQPGPGYLIKRPNNVWGAPRTVTAIQTAAKRYLDGGLGGPAVHVGDISQKSGGPFPPHLSYQDGRDVDLGYVLQRDVADVKRFVAATAGRLDVVRSWALLDAFLGTERVRYVFVDDGLQRVLYEHAKHEGVAEDRLAELFQYPREPAAAQRLSRHWRGPRTTSTSAFGRERARYPGACVGSSCCAPWRSSAATRPSPTASRADDNTAAPSHVPLAQAPWQARSSWHVSEPRSPRHCSDSQSSPSEHASPSWSRGGQRYSRFESSPHRSGSAQVNVQGSPACGSGVHVPSSSSA